MPVHGSKKGFTLIEYIVYLAVFSALSIATISMILGLIEVSRKASALQDIHDNARVTMETLAQEIRQAKSIYTPTSILGSNPGQLSLETKNYVSSGDPHTYVDVYIDGSSIYIKREGQEATRLTSKNVHVKNLTFTPLNQASTPALRITLILEAPSFPGSVHAFITTLSLRPQS